MVAKAEKISWQQKLVTGLLLTLIAGATFAAELEEGQSFEPGIELPEGPGRALLSTACTKCHDLKGVPAYKGYWNRARWLSMVETMIDHGAKLNAGEAAQVADYLAEHFGPQ